MFSETIGMRCGSVRETEIQVLIDRGKRKVAITATSGFPSVTLVIMRFIGNIRSAGPTMGLEFEMIYRSYGCVRRTDCEKVQL